MTGPIEIDFQFFAQTVIALSVGWMSFTLNDIKTTIRDLAKKMDTHMLDTNIHCSTDKVKLHSCTFHKHDS